MAVYLKPKVCPISFRVEEKDFLSLSSLGQLLKGSTVVTLRVSRMCMTGKMSIVTSRSAQHDTEVHLLGDQNLLCA